MEQYILKQVIIIRKDLKMRRGKEIAQGAHASMAAILPHMQSPEVVQWLAGPFAKVVVSVDSEEQLLQLIQQANDANLINCVITDQGRTEFHGVPTVTAAAIGPAPIDYIDRITGNLPLR